TSLSVNSVASHQIKEAKHVPVGENRPSCDFHGEKTVFRAARGPKSRPIRTAEARFRTPYRSRSTVAEVTQTSGRKMPTARTLREFGYKSRLVRTPHRSRSRADF